MSPSVGTFDPAWQAGPLRALGFREPFVAWGRGLPPSLEPRRVTSVHRGYVDVAGGSRRDDEAQPHNPRETEGLRADLDVERLPLGPALRHTAVAVGDWVAVDRAAAAPQVIQVAPRESALRRRAAGSMDTEQLLAANVDVALIVTALNEDFSIRRIERYLTVVREGGVAPVVVLSKADLCADVPEKIGEVRTVVGDAPVIAVSMRAEDGFEELDRWLRGPDGPRTVVLFGSSGVGKSTLINRWLGDDSQSVRETRGDGTGRHTTTRRSLFVVPGGGVVIDTPGMREIGIVGAEGGLAATFADIQQFAERCRFRDCHHAREPGCAVRSAVEMGKLDSARVEAFRGLARESERATSGYRRPARR